MNFTIVAELPLGTYRGAGPDGRPEPMPSVVRLHAALLCAAGFGPRAVAVGDGLGPCGADEVALRWLEEHPPDGVVIPPIVVNRGEAVAYRDDGTIKQTRARMTIKKLPNAPDAAVAVAGRFVWSWREPPPQSVRAALTALCADVPYLGTTESPVRLTADTRSVEPTHELDREAEPFASGGEDIEACRPGRTAELMAAHVRRTARPRSEPRAPYGTDEWSTSDVPPREAIEPLRYVPRGEPTAAVPWSRAILIPLSVAIAPRDRVAWAVAAHRALISLIGEGAPPLVTGVYPPGVARPANRLALHLVDSASPIAEGTRSPGTLAILLPGGASAADVDIVERAADRLPSVRGPRGQLARVVGAARGIPGSRFWAPPQGGRLRLWRTEPAAVPDTRGVRAPDWTFGHAALLSLGFVWKAQLPKAQGRGDDYYRHLARTVTESGAAVIQARPVRTTDVGRYVHRVNKDAVVRPYTAWLWLGDLADSTTIAAIGQSRHLGGGLLVPYDVPDGTALGDALPTDGHEVRP